MTDDQILQHCHRTAAECAGDLSRELIAGTDLSGDWIERRAAYLSAELIERLTVEPLAPGQNAAVLRALIASFMLVLLRSNLSTALGALTRSEGG